MKNLQLLLCGILVLFTCTLTAQNKYTINGESLLLKTEVEGSLTLLWNTIEGEFRYFSKKGNTILALKNSKENGEYTNKFRQTLASQTSDASISTEKVNLTLSSLRKFFNSYNAAVDPAFVAASEPLKPVLRLGGFAGITNSKFTENPTNALQFQIGAELEVVDRAKFKRHAMVLRLTNTFETSEYDFNAFQASLNYRFKFVMQSKFDLYANVKYATYTNTNATRLIEQDGVPEPVLIDISSDNYDVPFTLGLGADIALGKGYLTLFLDDLVGLNIEGNGEFPTNLLLGYKFDL